MDSNKQKSSRIRLSKFKKGKCKESNENKSPETFKAEEETNMECEKRNGQDRMNRMNAAFKSFKDKFRNGKFTMWRAKIHEPVYLSLTNWPVFRKDIVASEMNKIVALEDIPQTDANDAKPIPSSTLCVKNITTEETDTLSNGYNKLTQYGYYWGPMTRQEAELELHDQPDGSFLVRDSASLRHVFSISFRSWGKTLHVRIDFTNGHFSICDREGYPTIVELIEDAVKRSKESIYCYSRPRSPTDPSFPVRLVTPFSRLTRIQSLKHKCRFVIRQHVNINDINNLKLPATVIEYLKEGYF